jgi:hypothetical protein
MKVFDVGTGGLVQPKRVRVRGRVVLALPGGGSYRFVWASGRNRIR